MHPTLRTVCCLYLCRVREPWTSYCAIRDWLTKLCYSTSSWLKWLTETGDTHPDTLASKAMSVLPYRPCKSDAGSMNSQCRTVVWWALRLLQSGQNMENEVISFHSINSTHKAMEATQHGENHFHVVTNFSWDPPFCTQWRNPCTSLNLEFCMAQ